MKHCKTYAVLFAKYKRLFLAGGVINVWTCRVLCRQMSSGANTPCWSFISTKTTPVQISMWMLFTLERHQLQLMKMVHSFVY